MLAAKLKITAAVLLAAGVVLGAGLLAYLSADKDPASSKVLKLDGGGRRVAWAPDGKTLAVVTIYEPLLYGRKGSAIKLWDVETGQERQTLAEDAGGGLAFQQVVFSADGKTIAATVSEVVWRSPTVLQVRDVGKVWDAQTLALQPTLGSDFHLACLALSPDGTLAAAGAPDKKTVLLWNAGTGTLERTLKTGEAQPWSVAFSPDSKTLVVGGQKGVGSGEVTLWDARTGRLNRTLKQASFVTAVAFSQDGKMVAGCDGGEIVQVWDVENGEVIASLEGNKRCPRAVAFSPDSQTVAVGGPDGKVRLWDVQTGELIETLEGHKAEVYSIAFSPDGKTLASTSQDQTVRLWPINKRAAGPE